MQVDDPSGQTKFEYDRWDNLTALIDARNQRTTFEYDPDGKLKKEIRPLLQETLYEYDAQGRVWKILDAKGQMTEYGYDSQGRLETITRSGPGVQTSVCHLSYDGDGNLSGYSDGATSATYTYNAVGQKLTETVNYGVFSKNFSYTYYKNGLKKTFTGPDNIMYEYSYGNNNELKEIRIPGLGAITMPVYTWNKPATMVFPGGSKREFGYDPLMRLKSLTVKDPGGNALLDYVYEYDPLGNITTKTTEHGAYTYGYDESSRLTSADNPVLADENYTYDHVGNRQTASGVSGNWSYNTNNELLGFADVEYTYDANGNMTQKKIGTAAVNYHYNAENRLIKIEDDLTKTVIAEYGYDPFGRRLWKDVGGTRTHFFYSKEGLIAEYDATGTEIRSYGYQPDSTWTTDPLWLKQGGAYYWYQNDHLGTPQKLVAMNGAVVWSASYEAFGKAHVDIETVMNPLRFPGQYEDAETGLHYNRHRYYDPKIGRYLRTDPMGLRGEINVFSYASNNPVDNSDSMGLFVEPKQIVPPREADNLVKFDQLKLSMVLPMAITVLKADEKNKAFADFLSAHPPGVVLSYLGYKNNPGGHGIGSNHFVFTCKHGWIDMGHFYIMASLAYWRRVTGLGLYDPRLELLGLPDFDKRVGELQEFSQYLFLLMGRGHGNGESAYSPEDPPSNDAGIMFGRGLATKGAAADVAAEWHNFLVDSGAVDYQIDTPEGKKISEQLVEDVQIWWAKNPPSGLWAVWFGPSGGAPWYTGPRERWEKVKLESDAYKTLCCCKHDNGELTCSDNPVLPSHPFK